MKRYQRYWPVVVLVAGALAVATLHFVVDRLTRPAPNYSRIEEGLYLGGYVVEPPPGTRAVLNLCETADPYTAEVHRWVPIADAEPAPSLDWLREQVAFIDTQRQGGLPTYVHCRNGVSRSAMVVVAYLMWKNGSPRDEALAFVRTKRPEIRPNPAFMVLLAEWEAELKKR